MLEPIVQQLQSEFSPVTFPLSGLHHRGKLENEFAIEFRLTGSSNTKALLVKNNNKNKSARKVNKGRNKYERRVSSHKQNKKQ